MSRRYAIRTHSERYSRIEHAMTHAGSWLVPEGVTLVCIQCNRTIRFPRRAVGHEEQPVCMTCVDNSFQQGRAHGHSA